jgi:AraC-like DNA-binding protein
MAIEPIPAIRAAYQDLFLSILADCGGSDASRCRTFHLPQGRVDRPNAYLPLRSVLAFVQCAAGGGDLDGFIRRVGERMSVADFDADLRGAVMRAPSLESALQRFCTLADREQSPARYRLAPSGDAVRVRCSLGTGLPAGAGYLGEWLQILTLSALMRRFTGGRWFPTEIALQTSREPDECLRSLFPDTGFVTGQAETCVTLPASLLRFASIVDRSAFSDEEHRLVTHSPAAWDFAASLRAILRSYLAEGRLNINLVAGIAGCGVRTLQRRLKDCGQSFSDVLQQARFEVAAELLKDPDMKVIEAGYAVGYTDPSHFARAFRRVAGVSPKHYRTNGLLNEQRA